jgi:hypothetical protein
MLGRTHRQCQGRRGSNHTAYIRGGITVIRVFENNGKDKTADADEELEGDRDRRVDELAHVIEKNPSVNACGLMIMMMLLKYIKNKNNNKIKKKNNNNNR